MKKAISWWMVVLLCTGCAAESPIENSNDSWIYTPSADPCSSIESAILGEANKDYCISVTFRFASVDETETKHAVEMYYGYETNWTTEYLESHIIVVNAIYHVEYDNAKTFLSSGEIEQLFYLLLNDETGNWEIWTARSPSVQR